MPSFLREEEPEQLPGPLVVKHEGSPYPQGRASNDKGGERKLLDPMTTAQVFARVDISKDRLDVCLRCSEPERHNEVEAVVVAYDDDSGIDALVSRLLEERPDLVILEATGGFERTVVEEALPRSD